MNDERGPAARPAAPPRILSKSRLEAFSDGIFAIAATLLVLEIKVPDLSHADGAQAVALLFADWRTYLAYVTSFLVIGLIWINHHTLFHAVDEPDRTTNVLNLVLLMIVSFVSYPTALIAKYGSLQPVVALYGFTFALAAVAYNLLFGYIRRRYALDARSGADAFALRVSTLRQIAYPALYLVAALLSFLNRTASVLMYALIPIVYLFPSAVEWQMRRGAPLSPRTIDE